jgi:uncharacterized protein (UPF0264 family)
MRLLISIAAANEIPAALQGGADIVDVKDPAAGALGAASAEVLHAVCAELSPNHRISAALGDSDVPGGTLTLAAAGAAAFGARYVKLGLITSDIAAIVDLLRHLQQSVRLVNPSCGVIAVGYADADQIGAAAWQSLPDIGQASGIEGCMIDTAVKKKQHLFDHCQEPELARWLADCRQAGLLCALAGSLGQADLPPVRRLAPDVVGFRSAACDGSRISGQVSAERVAMLRAELDLTTHPL